jgi:hypothetical protein
VKELAISGEKDNTSEYAAEGYHLQLLSTLTIAGEIWSFCYQYLPVRKGTPVARINSSLKNNMEDKWHTQGFCLKLDAVPVILS